jgi:hypothetical protein
MESLLAKLVFSVEEFGTNKEIVEKSQIVLEFSPAEMFEKLPGGVSVDVTATRYADNIIDGGMVSLRRFVAVKIKDWLKDRQNSESQN